MRAGKCIAVMYHYVRDRAGTPVADISGLGVADFERQLDQLCEHLEPVDWPTFRTRLDRGADVPDNTFLLTFDDGLLDHAEVVAPILRRRGIRAAFFVQGGVLETGQMANHHQAHILRCILGDVGFRDAVAQWLAENGPAQDWNARIDPQQAAQIYHYETPMRARFKYLLSHAVPIAMRSRMLNDLFTRHVGDTRDWAGQWYMSWDDLKQLAADGHTIGGHGYRHEFYTRLEPADQSRDMSRIIALLRDNLGPGSRPFSYPYGSWTASVARRCALVGFVQAFSTGAGLVKPGTDPYKIPRIDTIEISRFLEPEVPCQPQ